jgi:hypothetical protein
MTMTTSRAALLVGIAVAFSVGANATVVDITALDSYGSLNDGFFLQAGIAPTGTGLISSFVRLSTNDPNEQGYNTSDRPLQFDENNSPQFTRDLLLTSVPLVTCSGGAFGGTSTDVGCTDGQYREFLLDINQTGADPLLSLDRVVIYLRSAGSLSDSGLADGTQLGLASALFPSGTVVYDSGIGNRVDLNYLNDAGSGQGDMFLYVPNSLFVGGTNIYLYSEFGLFGGGTEPPYDTNDGFEEWAVRAGPGNPPDVPEPVSSALVGTGLIGLFLLRRRASRKA